MRLCTFRRRGTTERPVAGVIQDGQVSEVRPHGFTLGADPLKELLTAKADIATLERGSAIRLDDAELLAPIGRPDKFICIGLNYENHAKEAGIDIPGVPTFFVKLPNAIIGPEDGIPLPKVSSRIDWEGELAVVVGRRCKDVAEDDAMGVVAGYTVTNDVTARDYQFKTSQWNLGKTFDGFAPLGPWITTLDEIADPQDLHLTTTVNDEVVQDARTSDLIFGVPALISFFSTLMTLEPGDVIATGTPSGIGAMMKPRRWLTAGDRVSIEIEHVGQLTNTVFGPP